MLKSLQIKCLRTFGSNNADVISGESLLVKTSSSSMLNGAAMYINLFVYVLTTVSTFHMLRASCFQSFKQILQYRIFSH